MESLNLQINPGSSGRAIITLNQADGEPLAVWPGACRWQAARAAKVFLRGQAALEPLTPEKHMARIEFATRSRFWRWWL